MKRNGVVKYLAFIFTIILLVSTWVFFRKENTEFVYYNILFFFLIMFVLIAERRLKFKFSVIIGLGVVLVMHLLGGLVQIGDMRLYDIPLGPFAYDNLLHFAIGFVFAVLSLNLFHKVHEWKKTHKAAFFFFIVLCTLGLGALVEIAEYIGVEFLKAPGVGDYVNNARDLVFDVLGAIVAAIMMLVTGNGKR
jgi:uncharacterized membrane protein YjdF